MLIFSDIRKSYRDLKVLKRLTLSVPRGSFFRLMGQSDAGKAVLLRVVAGLLVLDSGKLLVGGTDARRGPTRAKRPIGFMPDGFGAYSNMLVAECVNFFASCFGLCDRGTRLKAEDLLQRVGLSARQGSLATEPSEGIQQRLSPARALTRDPELLVLGEPTSGLGPGSRFLLRELPGELSESGEAILLSSYVPSRLSEICTNIAVLDKGWVRATGEVQEILRQIANSNPLQAAALNSGKTILRMFRTNPCVRTMIQEGKQFHLEFIGSPEDEIPLLQQFIGAEVPVKSSVRESGTLEPFPLSVTVGREERVVVCDEDEPDI